MRAPPKRPCNDVGRIDTLSREAMCYAPDLLDRIIYSTGDTASREAAEFVERTRCIVMQKPYELRTLESVVANLRRALAVS